LELFRQCGICCFHTVGTAPISNRKRTNTTLSEQLQYLTENNKYHTVRTAPISNRKTPNTVLELFRQCGICCFSVRYWSCSDSAVFVVFLLDIGAVPAVRYLLFYNKYRTVGTAPISNRKTTNTALSEQLQYLTEKQ
jgi:hypothetical protein